jgi:hypothetical protein
MSHKGVTFGFIFFLAILISGCTTLRPVLSPTAILTPSQLLPTITLTFKQYPTPSMTSTFTPTSLPSFTPMTPSPTLTYTPIPSTPTQTLTPAPTLTEVQRRAYFIELLRDNAGCKLPCWWGITPGVSTWEELRTLINFSGFSRSYDPLSNGAIYHGTGYYWDTPFITNDIGFYDVIGVIEAIDVHAVGYEDKNAFRTLWNNYSPDQIMTTYGQPTEVYVAVGVGQGEIAEPASDVILKYNDEFMIMYSVRPIEVSDQDEPMYRICPSWQDITWGSRLDIFIISANYSISLEEYVELISSINLEPYIPIEEAAGISAQEFYNSFLPGNGPACFDTPQDLWR